MPAREFPHRAREHARRRLHRRITPRHLVSHAPPRPVFAPLVEAICDLPGTAPHTGAIAQEALRDRVRIFDTIAIFEDGAPAWHTDPKSGERWPTKYCFDIDYRHPRRNSGDVKYVWELNRLLYLVPVAAAARQTDAAELVAVCAGHITSWIAKNPPYLGLGWSSGIECALRIVALGTVDELLEDRLPPELRAQIRDVVSRMCHWIGRFPSRYSSANNHRIAEIVGQLAAEARFPGTLAARETRSLLQEIESEALRQVHSDGVSSEQASGYATFATEWLALAARVGHVLGADFHLEFHDRLRKSVEFLDAITDCAGNTVVFGDDDESRILTTLVPRQRTLAALWAMIGRRKSAVTSSMRVFAVGGYTVARDQADEREALWVLDHGPLGLGQIAAHAHADTLSVWLHVNGEPLFVDAGTYLYHAAQNWRDLLRSTRLHNTLTVEGQDSSQPAGPFNWRRQARARGRLLTADAGPHGWRVVVDHDGYLRGFGARHQRVLERTGSVDYTIVDRLVGVRRPWRVRATLLLAPDIVVEEADTGWLLKRRGQRLALVSPDEESQRELRVGDAEAGLGWHSDRFGQVSATSMLIADKCLSAYDSLAVRVSLL